MIRFFGPFGVASSPVATKTMTKSACSAPLMKCLVPFTTQSPVPLGPARRAKHFIARTSEPASGSVMASASIRSPRTAGSR